MTDDKHVSADIMAAALNATKQTTDDKDSRVPISIEHLGELLSQLDDTILTDNERAEILVEAYERMTAAWEQRK